MNYVVDDIEYKNIVDDILENDTFNLIKANTHHGISRFDHSLKVSYYSYKIAKKLKINYIDVARGGLLHDFFISPIVVTNKEKLISTFVHPKKAVKNAIEIFNVNEQQQNIIKGHMFPIYYVLPKTTESWLVNIVDKCIAVYEFKTKYQNKLSYIVNLYLVFLINFIK